MNSLQHILRDHRHGLRRLKRKPRNGEFGRSGPAPRPAARAEAVELPHRPDASILNAAIPVFFVGRDNDGFWVARESEGKVGGIFLRRSAALRFAHQVSAPGGCAIMEVPHMPQLDLQNNGNPSVHEVAALKHVLLRFLRRWSATIQGIAAPWRKLTARLSRARAINRLHRKAIEQELFHGRYRLASKYDDDLPMAR